MKQYQTYKNIGFALLVSCSLTACGAGERLANVGKEPQLTAIQNPQLKPDYQPISMPMPAPKVANRQPNSLWDSNRQAFFKDQRAADVGDILTVLIEIQDKAELDNESTRSRSSGENAGVDGLLGYEGSLGAILPEAVNPANLVGVDSDSNHTGSGAIDREEKIEVKLAALVTQILPNGNFAIEGSQEVRVNFEKRILKVAGVIRPQDISIGNTIAYEQIAEARIAYGGEGQITDVQQPRYGQQVYDILFPF
ncbi:MAG: flagellar basal body L-ring protein FlgH [Alphaproteobacteria bacterium]|nr:flagellar basal body L-ring protein FlgH [Alphaproteobacteria bacterium]